jgi:hypothetical protein
MKPRQSILLIAVLSVFLVVLSGAIAAQATEAEEEPGAEVVEPTQLESGAAVEVPPAEEAEDEQPWTVRFMYPVIVGGSLLLLIFITLYYFVRIKGRYEVVEG